MGLTIQVIDKIEEIRNRETLFNKWKLPQRLCASSNTEIINWLEACYLSEDSNLPLTQEQVDWRNNISKELRIPKLHEKVGMQDGKPEYLDLSSQQNVARIALNLIDIDPIATFNIGFTGFFLIRKELIKFFGGEYYYSQYYTKEAGTFLAGKPKLDSMRVRVPDFWVSGNPTGQALYSFFLHSDWDGIFSEADIHLLAKCFKDNEIRIKAKKYCQSDVKEKLLNFIDFTIKSSKGPYYWNFA